MISTFTVWIGLGKSRQCFYSLIHKWGIKKSFKKKVYICTWRTKLFFHDQDNSKFSHGWKSFISSGAHDGTTTWKYEWRVYLRCVYCILKTLPSIARVWPVMKEAESEAKKAMVLATSSTVPTRPMACVVLLCSKNASYLSSESPERLCTWKFECKVYFCLYSGCLYCIWKTLPQWQLLQDWQHSPSHLVRLPRVRKSSLIDQQLPWTCCRQPHWEMLWIFSYMYVCKGYTLVVQSTYIVFFFTSDQLR